LRAWASLHRYSGGELECKRELVVELNENGI
jgi:hypothetical protein